MTLPPRYDSVTRLVDGQYQAVDVWSADDMRAAIAAERERCAVVCEVEAVCWRDNHGEAAEDCAAAIRALADTQSALIVDMEQPL